MVTRRDYNKEQVEAAHAVMLELVRLLGEYHDDMVLVGGWVPALLLPQDKIPHVGSMDVDLALNHKTLQDPGYKTIRDLLISRGYRQDDEQPFIFWRDVMVGENTIEVEVDLLAGEYEGRGKKHRTQKVQDVRARKARGCELAFELTDEIAITGKLPDGAKDTARVRVASIVPFIIMKAMAAAGRFKEKDPWDIYYCVRNYPGGADALVEHFWPVIDNGLVKEGLQKIAEQFGSPDHTGPKSVADFDEVTDPEERARIQRDAFERVDHILRKLGVR